MINKLSRLAIIVGNSEYDHLHRLSCCADDVNAMQEFLKETHGYDQIEILQNLKANDLKDRLREIVAPEGAYKEILFYFTGHGHNIRDIFYFCSADFDSNRPNETGLSNEDLLEIFRASNADLIVQIIDACNSGTRIIKDACYGILPPPTKEGIRNYILIASCLNDQNSLTGDPLSVFTEKFIEASLKKTKGEVFYSDVINVLRDAFIENNTQTPYFISQGTGREIFIRDAAMLDTLREKMTPRPEAAAQVENVSQIVSLKERLKQEEDRFCTKDLANKFIEKLFQSIKLKVVQSQIISECYTPNINDHERYSDNNEAFMVRVLSKEKRPDELVTAELKRKRKKRNPLFNATSVLMQSTIGLYDDEDILETYDLSLNCSLEKAELTIILQSNYQYLPQFKLVVSCAPSVEHCYVFERCSLHKLSDWNSYSHYGEELTRRWYKMNWKEDKTDSVARKISDEIHVLVEKHVLNFLNDDEKGK